ncbi:MAG: 3-dehydroquinate synthase [Panacagrimonas sp.]
MIPRILNVDLGERAYPIRIGGNLLGDPASYTLLRGRRAMLLTDENVARHYLEPMLTVLKLDRDQALVLPSGETQKTWEQAGQVLDWMLQARLGRDGVLLALGGGVIGDLGGFVAAICQRGIDYVQVPTTLLAQVDSSVGGKTAVNHARGKNLIGSFHQPITVVADTGTLATLPERELRSGFAEVIKYGLLDDALLFNWIEKNLDRIVALDPQFIGETIERCCAIKARIVGLDERESIAGGPRSLLNLGHTFGHAIETSAGYGEWLHGEAIAVGLCMAADMSHRLGWIKAAEVERVTRMLAHIGLPTRPPAGMKPADFHELMSQDKKVKAGKLRLVLLRSIGEAVLSADFDESTLDATLEKFCWGFGSDPGPDPAAAAKA